MTDYTYTRTLSGGHYDIDNKSRVDGGGLQIFLAKEIEAALPGKEFCIKCAGTVVTIRFVDELSAGDKTTLDSIVSDHKNNV